MKPSEALQILSEQLFKCTKQEITRNRLIYDNKVDGANYAVWLDDFSITKDTKQTGRDVIFAAVYSLSETITEDDVHDLFYEVVRRLIVLGSPSGISVIQSGVSISRYTADQDFGIEVTLTLSWGII